MRRAALVSLATCCAPAAGAAAPEFGGQVMPIVSDQRPNGQGPLAQAASLTPGIVAPPASSLAVEAELRASGHGLTAVATQREERPEGGALRSHGWVNEFYAAGGGDVWQFSAGKKIVGWDVGYAFRPNDVVQQETRRLLLPTTLEGRPLVMAERFDASSAWTFVVVNPSKPRAQRGAEEPAFAARVYRRAGAVDGYAFVRWGTHTRGSAGAALSWVASESVEAHVSYRWLDGADTLAIDPAASGLVRSNPWLDTSVRQASQALVGGTWTNAEQWSVLAEAWWDGTALSDAQWDAWNARNRLLGALVGTPAPASAIGGNLAWQANAFNASSSLRRANVFGRVSWKHEQWEPALDLLLTPADHGRIVTASLGCQGDRVRLDAGWRYYGGPDDAVLAQLPSRSTAYVAATWPF